MTRRERLKIAAGTASPASLTYFAATAKRVIYLFQSGAPSQIDLFVKPDKAVTRQ